MYVLQNAFPYRRMGRILAVLFAIFAVLASFGMGNMTQGNSIAEALAVTFGVDRTVTGLVIGIFTILVILGGIDKIARVTEYLVPCMAVFYLFGTGMVIFTHFHNLPSGILQILCGAFCPEAMAGGSIGFLWFRQAGHALWCLPWSIFQRSGTRSSRNQCGLCRYTGCGAARLYQHDGSFYRYHCDLFPDRACHSIPAVCWGRGMRRGSF